MNMTQCTLKLQLHWISFCQSFPWHYSSPISWLGTANENICQHHKDTI